MKTQLLIIIIAAVILLGVCNVQATTIAFYTDGVIQEGDEYVSVGVYNDATVDMTGGIVTFQLTSYESSIVNISGGILEAIVCKDGSTLNLYGNMKAGGMSVSGSGTVNVFGGNVNSLKIGSANAANLYGGTISDYLKATSTVNIYGYGFEYDPLAGDYWGGQLTGFWLDDTPFSIDLYYSDTMGAPPIDTYSHVVLIPEPATILLFAFGWLALRKRN